MNYLKKRGVAMSKGKEIGYSKGVIGLAPIVEGLLSEL